MVYAGIRSLIFPEGKNEFKLNSDCHVMSIAFA